MIMINVVEKKRIKWDLRYKFCINIIKNRFENNLFVNYENEINAHILWNVIYKNNKFKGFDMFNDLYH